MKIFLYLIAAAALALVTIFGLGPVLFADGTARERLLTLLVIVLLYVLIGLGIERIRKYYKNKKA